MERESLKKTLPLDLTIDYPRSPREKLGLYVHLARMVDKARAKSSGTIGEYLFPCPLDQVLLDFLGMDEPEFSKGVEGKGDLEIVEWINQDTQSARPEVLEKWNEAFLSREPIDEEGKRRFFRKRKRIAPGRSDLKTWVDLLDIDEDREVPVRSI